LTLRIVEPNQNADLYDASQILCKAVGTLAFLPPSHISAFETYVRSLQPLQSSPHAVFFAAFLALYANVEAILKALARPPQTIAKINAIRREAERNYSSLNRSSRWPLGLLDDTRQRMNEEREEKARRNEHDAELLCKELRYTQQTVAGELAGWRDMHERLGRKAIKDLARGMLTAEKMRLEGIQRALRKVREAAVWGGASVSGNATTRRQPSHDTALFSASVTSRDSGCEGDDSNNDDTDTDDLFGSEDGFGSGCVRG